MYSASRAVARSSTSCGNRLAARAVGGVAGPLAAGAGGFETGREISENCLWKAARGIDAEMSATQEELVQMLAADISASIPRAAFQRQFSEISRPVSKPPAPAASGPAVPPTALAASRFPQEVLDRATARLAEYIGALSRVAVKRASVKAG